MNICNLSKGCFSTAIDEAARYGTVDILSQKSDAGGLVFDLLRDRVIQRNFSVAGLCPGLLTGLW
jgi:hypothetical protein